MHLFIETLYSVIIAVGFYHLGDKVSGKINISFLWTNFFSPESFKIFLFLCTYIIAAHDWFSFHRVTEERDKFTSYIFQIAAMFFLSQMVVSASAGTLQLWYIYGLGYVLASVMDSIFINHNFSQYWLKYVIHLTMTIGGAVAFSNDYDVANFKWVFFTMLLVMAIWIQDACCEKRRANITSTVLHVGLSGDKTKIEITTSKTLGDDDYTIIRLKKYGSEKIIIHIQTPEEGCS